MRTARVFAPRITRKQSNGPGTPPTAFWWNLIVSPMVWSFVTVAPPTTSLCPAMYFVVE